MKSQFTIQDCHSSCLRHCAVCFEEWLQNFLHTPTWRDTNDEVESNYSGDFIFKNSICTSIVEKKIKQKIKVKLPLLAFRTQIVTSMAAVLHHRLPHSSVYLRPSCAGSSWTFQGWIFNHHQIQCNSLLLINKWIVPNECCLNLWPHGELMRELQGDVNIHL